MVQHHVRVSKTALCVCQDRLKLLGVIIHVLKAVFYTTRTCPAENAVTPIVDQRY